jgi:hypothetical protein
MPGGGWIALHHALSWIYAVSAADFLSMGTSPLDSEGRGTITCRFTRRGRFARNSTEGRSETGVAAAALAGFSLRARGVGCGDPIRADPIVDGTSPPDYHR